MIRLYQRRSVWAYQKRQHENNEMLIDGDLQSTANYVSISGSKFNVY